MGEGKHLSSWGPLGYFQVFVQTSEIKVEGILDSETNICKIYGGVIDLKCQFHQIDKRESDVIHE